MSVTTRWKKLDSSIPIASSTFAAVLQACSTFSDWPKRVARSARASLSSSTIRSAVSLVFIVFSRVSHSVGEESAERNSIITTLQLVGCLPISSKDHSSFLAALQANKSRWGMISIQLRRATMKNLPYHTPNEVDKYGQASADSRVT